MQKKYLENIIEIAYQADKIQTEYWLTKLILDEPTEIKCLIEQSSGTDQWDYVSEKYANIINEDKVWLQNQLSKQK